MIMINYKYYFLLCFFVFTSLIGQDQNLFNKFRLAESYEQSNQLEKAKSLYEEIYSSQPNNNQFLEALNRTYIRLKEYNKSVELLNSAINRTPQDVTKYGLLGSTYYLMDDAEKAFQIWDEGIKAIPNSIITYRVIANYAIENRAFDKAIEILTEGKKINNDPKIFSYDLANLYSISMNFEGAVNEYVDLLDNDPNQLAIVKNRIASYLNRPGAVNQSADELNKIIEEKPKVIYYDLLAFIFIQGNDYEKALSVFIESDRTFIKNGSSVYNLGETALRDGSIETAVKAFAYVLENYPNSPFSFSAKIGFAKSEEARLNKEEEKSKSWKPYFINEYNYKSAYQKIIDSYNSFLQKETARNPYYFEALYRIADIQKNKMNNQRTADSLFSIIIQKAPISEYGSNSYLELGNSSIDNNDLEKAKELFENGLKLYRATPEQQNAFKFKLAKINFWSGNFSDALNYLSEITVNLNDNKTNDALELSFIINVGKRDSLSLLEFARADLAAEQEKFNIAAENFKLLSQNKDLFVLNDVSKLKYAEMLAALNYLPETVNILEEIVNLKTKNIFSDKSLFFLGEVYEFGLLDSTKAINVYKNLLENYPNSIYFEKCREKLNYLTTKKSNI